MAEWFQYRSANTSTPLCTSYFPRLAFHHSGRKKIFKQREYGISIKDTKEQKEYENPGPLIFLLSVSNILKLSRERR
jgi:hypothetical protein